MSEASQDAVISVGDPSIDYAPPTTDTVTVAGLDVAKFPQGSMVAVHGLRAESYAPYLDDPAAQGKSTEDGLVNTQDGVLTPAGHWHSDIHATFEGDPYAPVEFTDINDDGVTDVGDTVSVGGSDFTLGSVPASSVADSNAPIGSAPLANPISVS